MKITHYFDRVRLERGGTIRACLDMCRVLAGRGHEVTLITHDDADVPEAWRAGADGLPRVVTIPGPTLPGGFYAPGAMGRAVPAIDPEAVVHLHNIWMPSTAQFCSVAREAGVPIVLSCHGMLDDWSMAQSSLKKSAYLALAGRRMLNSVDVFHATAEAEAKQAGRRVAASRIAIAPYITDLSAFESLPGPGLAREAFGLEGGGTPTVLFLSRLHYKKQPDVLIRAGALLRDRGTPVRVLLAGTGEDEYVGSLRRLAASLGLGEELCGFLGMVTGDTKLSLYEAVDLFALPTSQENFGLVYTESLACRTPIIATRGTDIWRELDASGACTLAEATAEGFADAIAARIADRDGLASLGERGRSYVFEWLDMDTIAASFESMYERALSSRGTA